MSETAFTGGRRASHAYHWGRERLTPQQFRRLDIWQQAAELATRPASDREQYDALKREDEYGNSDELLPGDRGYDDGPEDWGTL